MAHFKRLTAGLGMGFPGSGVTCAGSEGRCIDWVRSCTGWMMEVFLAGTSSGVGMVSPVGGGMARAGTAGRPPGRPPIPRGRCFAIWKTLFVVIVVVYVSIMMIIMTMMMR